MSSDHGDMQVDKLHPLDATIPEGHVGPFQKFADDLNASLKHVYPSGAKPYADVHVLLTYFYDLDMEPDDTLAGGMDAVLEIFQNDYHYDCEAFEIPKMDPPLRAELELRQRVQRFVATHGLKKDALLILYYVGHGEKSVGSKSCVWRNNDSKHRITVDFDAIQTMFNSLPCDVLFVLDCCFAGSERFGKEHELLGATGWGEEAVSGQKSFSQKLVKVLKKQKGKSTTVALLYGKIIEGCVVKGRPQPIYIQHGESNNGGSIVIEPLDAPSTIKAATKSVSGQSGPLFQVDGPKVLIKAAIDGTSGVRELEKWKEWLSRNTPPHISHVDISVEGIFKGASTVVLFAVPPAVWAVMKAAPGYSFVSFILGPNKLLQKVSHEKESSGETAMTEIFSPGTSPSKHG